MIILIICTEELRGVVPAMEAQSVLNDQPEPMEVDSMVILTLVRFKLMLH